MNNTDTKIKTKKLPWRSLYTHLGAALLLWFIAFSLGLLLATCFQADIHDDRGVPMVLNNLWKISVYSLPVYGLCYQITKSHSSAVCSGAIIVVLVSLSSDLTSLPSSENITFINSDSETAQSTEEQSFMDEELEMSSEEESMELPDEL